MGGFLLGLALPLGEGGRTVEGGLQGPGHLGQPAGQTDALGGGGGGGGGQEGL